MNGFQMPPYVTDGVLKKRGRLHVFDRFEPAKTAFLVVDMQNFFVDGVDACSRIVPNINRLAARVRDTGGLVVWVVLAVADSPEGPSLWPVYHDNFFTPEKRRAHIAGLARGTPGYALDSRLEIDPQDMTSEKIRFSAFVQGSSDLHERLQERGIENLLIGGTLTHICCESTARDAMMTGYRVTMVEDCNAALTEEDHFAGLASVFQVFGDVRSTDDIVANVLVAGDAAAAAE